MYAFDPTGPHFVSDFKFLASCWLSQLSQDQRKMSTLEFHRFIAATFLNRPLELPATSHFPLRNETLHHTHRPAARFQTTFRTHPDIPRTYLAFAGSSQGNQKTVSHLVLVVVAPLHLCPHLEKTFVGKRAAQLRAQELPGLHFPVPS